MKRPGNSLPAFAVQLLEDETIQYGRKVALASGLLQEILEGAVPLAEDAAEMDARAVAAAQYLVHDRRIRLGARHRNDDFTLTATVLNRRGNCLGVTTLYCLLARSLRIPVIPLLFDGHIMPCLMHHQRSSRHLIEFIADRVRLTDRHWRLLPTTGGRPAEMCCDLPGHGRALTDTEFLAVHRSNRLSFFLSRGDWNIRSLEMIDQAIRDFPDYLPARINRAFILLKLQRFDAAAAEIEQLSDVRPYFRPVLRSLVSQAVSGLIRNNARGRIRSCPGSTELA